MKRTTIHMIVASCLLVMLAIPAGIWSGQANREFSSSSPVRHAYCRFLKLLLCLDPIFYPPSHPFAIRRLILLANINNVFGRKEDADRDSLEALSLCEKYCPPESRLFFQVLLRRGDLCDDSFQAAAALRKALRIAYRHAFKSEISLLNIAGAEEELADVLGFRGEYQGQLKHYQRARDWRLVNRAMQDLTSKSYSPAYEDEATLLEKTALCCQSAGLKEKADELMAQAGSLRKKTDTKLPADYWLRKGEFALAKDQAAQAEKYFFLALEQLKQTPDFSAVARYGMVRSLCCQNKLVQAEKAAVSMLRDSDLIWTGHTYASTQLILADIYSRENRTAEALQLLQKCEPELVRQRPRALSTVKMYELHARLLKPQARRQAEQMAGAAEAVRAYHKQEKAAQIPGSIACQQVYVVPHPGDVRLLQARLDSLKKELEYQSGKDGRSSSLKAPQLVEAADLLMTLSALKNPDVFAKRTDRQYQGDNETEDAFPADTDTAEEAVSGASRNTPEKENNSEKSADKKEEPVTHGDSEGQVKKDCKQAQAKYETALSLLEKQQGKPEVLIRCLKGLGKCYANLGKSETAEKTFKRALALCEKQQTTRLLCAGLLECLSELSPGKIKTEPDLRKYKFDLLKRALAIYESELGAASAKVTEVLFKLAELSWYIPEAKPAGKDLLSQANSSLADLFERDLNAFGPVHPQIIEDLELSGRFCHGDREPGPLRVAIYGLFFGENDLDFIGELKTLSTFDGMPFSLDAKLTHWYCLIPLLVLLFGLLVFTLARLPYVDRVKEKKAFVSLIALSTFFVCVVLSLFFLPDPAGLTPADAPLELDARVLQRVLALQEKTNNYAEVVETLDSLGLLFMRLRKYSQSESYFKQAESICARQPELPQHITREVHENYAVLLRFLNRPRQAKLLEDSAGKNSNDKTEKER